MKSHIEDLSLVHLTCKMCMPLYPEKFTEVTTECNRSDKNFGTWNSEQIYKLVQTHCIKKADEFHERILIVWYSMDQRRSTYH